MNGSVANNIKKEEEGRGKKKNFFPVRYELCNVICPLISLMRHYNRTSPQI